MSHLAKRALDVTLATAGLVVSAPLWPLIAAAIKIDSRGPVFYAQRRVGEGGRPFTVVKFRSMIPDAERDVGPLQMRAVDPRVTRVGRLLRTTAMDELPQLVSIVRGEMSFVGPRALRPEEIDADSAAAPVPLTAIPGFRQRCTVPPCTWARTNAASWSTPDGPGVGSRRNS